MKTALKLTFLLFCMGLLSNCGKKSNPSPVIDDPTEPSVFSRSPVDLDKINFLLSLGWLQPVGHTIPTDHVYFHVLGTAPVPVYAPGGGRVNQILDVPVMGVKEVKVWIKMNSKFMYYLDHIVLDPEIKQGTTLVSGQKIGVTGYGTSIDLGVIDENINVPFANPLRYAGQTSHCGKPFQYFVEPIKTQLYALVDRQGTEKDGWVNTDVVGHLSGNWFLDDGNFYMDGPNGWDKELSFAYDIQRPATVMVSIGGILCTPGKWSLEATAIKPADVTPANGKIAYNLLNIDPNPPHSISKAGLLIVQMLDEKHIKIQVFLGSSATDAAFDNSAKIYAR
jgi:hypothetical protein